VKQFTGYQKQTRLPYLRPAFELLHLPDKPAGVEVVTTTTLLAFELLHLLDKPAGVEKQVA